MAGTSIQFIPTTWERCQRLSKIGGRNKETFVSQRISDVALECRDGFVRREEFIPTLVSLKSASNLRQKSGVGDGNSDKGNPIIASVLPETAL